MEQENLYEFKKLDNFYNIKKIIYKFLLEIYLL